MSLNFFSFCCCFGQNRKSLFGEDLNSLDEFDEDDFDSKFFYVGDVYRTQVFVNTFVRYNRCYFLDLTLTETE